MLALALLLFGQLASAGQSYTIVSHSISESPTSGSEKEIRLDGYDSEGRNRLSVYRTRVVLNPNPNHEYYSLAFLGPDNRTTHGTTLTEKEYLKLVKDLKKSPVNSTVNKAMSWISNGCVVTVNLTNGPLLVSSDSSCPQK